MHETIQAVAAYRDNPLIDACGPIFPGDELAKRLVVMPEIPPDIAQTPFHIRKHQLQSIWDLHIPSQEGIRIAESIGMMLRNGYSRCRPGTPDFWKRIYSDQHPVSKPLAASVVGVSGLGKTFAIEQALKLYPRCVEHDRIPGFVSAFKQLIWLKVDAPPSGKLVDLAEHLMINLDDALGSMYFQETLGMKSKSGPKMFVEWYLIARKHTLGLLVIDEIQNLFKQAPVKDRRAGGTAPTRKHELRIVEDQTLKHILWALNSWGIPIMVAGTPDGIEAFNSRMATMQRFATGGMFKFVPPAGEDDLAYSKSNFPVLARYQWVDKMLPRSKGFSDLVFKLSAGIPRIYKALWVAAHLHAFEEKRDELTFEDFNRGLRDYAHMVKPAVDALLSKDPLRLARYEDAIPKDPTFWEQYR